MTMPAKHKIVISGIFLLGLLTVCASIAKVIVFNRLNYMAMNGDADVSYLLTPTVYWPMVESSLGIVGACLPLLRPLFSRKGDSRGFGQVKRLLTVRQSVRLSSTDGGMPEMKPWNEDEMGGSKSGSVSTIRKLVPSALLPLGEDPGDHGSFAEKGLRKGSRADSNV